MARLPQSIDSPAPVTERPNTDTARPTDYGLGDLAQGVAAVAEAKSAWDDKHAREILGEVQAKVEPKASEMAAAYDGRSAGWAAGVAAAAEPEFQAALARQDIPAGVRASLARQLDQYKARLGTWAVGQESQKRAGIVADQQKLVEAQGVNAGYAVFQQTYAQGHQALRDAYDGSHADFIAQDADLVDKATQAALEATPEAYRPGLQMRIEGVRPGLTAQALAAQDEGVQTYLATQTQSNINASVNSVRANPAGYALAQASADHIADGLHPELRDKLVTAYKGQLAAARIAGLLDRDDFTGAQAELKSGAYDKVLDPATKGRLTEAVQAHAAKLAGDLIEGMRYGADADPDKLRAATTAAKDPGLTARAEFYGAVGAMEPEALAALGKGGGKPAFLDAANFVIDKLEGGDQLVLDDNGRGPTRFGINSQANPDLNVAGLTRLGAVGRYKRYWAAVQGDRLPPALALVAFDAAVNQGPDAAREMLAQSQGDVGVLLKLRADRYRELAAQPGQAKNLPSWLTRLKNVGQEAARRQAFANTEEGVTSDPVKFALGGGSRAPLMDVPPLPQEMTGPAFQAALKGRVAVAGAMQQYRAPFRLLTNGEAALLKDQIAQDPTRALSLAQDAAAAVGPRAARSMLGEVGLQGSAGVNLHLADLAASGSDVFAKVAARGLALKGEGAKALDAQQSAALDAEVDRAKAAFVGQPELRVVVRQTAEAAMLADAQAATPHPASYYVNSALGARQARGVVYGGVAQLNGAQVVAPHWLAADQMDEALEHLAESWTAQKIGPRYAGGAPATARDLARARLQMLPNGHYQILTARGEAYRAPDGVRPFTFDLDAALPFLRSVMPRAVLIPQNVQGG